jgi:hypothetical protein
LGISLAAVIVAAFVLVQPITSYSQVGAEGILLSGCVLAADQPEDPIDMNTVVGTKGATEYAKTIHREKQIFECEDVNDPTISYLVEMALFLEILESMDDRGETQAAFSEVVTCIKEVEDDVALDPFPDGTVIECQRRTPATQIVPTFDCAAVDPQIQYPLEMNTVVDPDNNNIIKTIDAEKEVYTCENGTNAPLKKVDQIIFTEIWEDLGRLSKNPVVKRTILDARCTIAIPFAIAESCIVINLGTPLIPP